MLNVKVRWTVVEMVAGRRVTTSFDTKEAAEKYALPAGGYRRGVRRSIRPLYMATKTTMGAALFAALGRN